MLLRTSAGHTRNCINLSESGSARPWKKRQKLSCSSDSAGQPIRPRNWRGPLPIHYSSFRFCLTRWLTRFERGFNIALRHANTRVAHPDYGLTSIGQRGRYDTTDRPIGVKPIVPEHRDRNVDFDVVESLESLRMMVITASAATGLVWNRSSQPLRVCWRPLFHTSDGRLSERGFRRGTYEPRNRFYRCSPDTMEV